MAQVEVRSQQGARTGAQFRIVKADSGNIGGSRSEEFHVLANSGEDLLAGGASHAAALNDGYHLAFWIGVGLVAAAVVVAALVIKHVQMPEAEMAEPEQHSGQPAEPAYSEAA